MQPFIARFRSVRLAAGLAASVLFTQAAVAAPTVSLDKGTTSVTLTHQFIDAVASLQVSLGVVEPATVNGLVAAFPFLDGAIDVANAKGEIIHAGGLTLTAGGTTVTLTDFIIDTTGAQPVLTGLVTAGGSVLGRLPLFDLALPALTLPLTPNSSGKVIIRDVAATLTAEAAAALNATFQVTAFTAGFPIGAAKVKAKMISTLE